MPWRQESVLLCPRIYLSASWLWALNQHQGTEKGRKKRMEWGKKVWTFHSLAWCSHLKTLGKLSALQIVVSSCAFEFLGGELVHRPFILLPCCTMGSCLYEHFSYVYVNQKSKMHMNFTIATWGNMDWHVLYGFNVPLPKTAASGHRREGTTFPTQLRVPVNK